MTTRSGTTRAASPTKSSRKPLGVRNVATPDGDRPTAATKKAVAKAKFPDIADSDESLEPIVAYLRIRPNLSHAAPDSEPYLSVVDEHTARVSSAEKEKADDFSFSHVFDSLSTQPDFFRRTTLPLVQDVLEGRNALVFAYGVTNSGKTYTVQGGSAPGSAGILPRALDVVFNSVEGMQGDAKYRPVRLQGIERSTTTDTPPPLKDATTSLSSVLSSLPSPLPSSTSFPSLDSDDTDSTTLPLDKNHTYTIYLSFAEIYNEKVYDLLSDLPAPSSGTRTRTASKVTPTHPITLTRTALPLKSCPEAEGGGRHIHGLRQFRVRTAAEAKALIRFGTLHRQVYSTVANAESSRSHGAVVLKIARVHRAERDDPNAYTISRLTLVDLAGSERAKLTQTSGERLREAASINKSLMVLGQCLKTLRSNQRKLASALYSEETFDTRSMRSRGAGGMGVVPYNDSTLTRMLMDYLEGDGRTAIIVNINPYDTGYDENARVMEFSALAKSVFVRPASPMKRTTHLQVQPPPKNEAGEKGEEGGDGKEKEEGKGKGKKNGRKSRRITLGGTGKDEEEVVLDIVEDDDPNPNTRSSQGSDSTGDDGDKDKDGVANSNPLIDALFEENEKLRFELAQSLQTNAQLTSELAVIERETREEVMRAMQEKMERMAEGYERLLRSEKERNEQLTDAKLDLLSQFGSPAKPTKRTREMARMMGKSDGDVFD